jgi:hypothetical protein
MTSCSRRSRRGRGSRRGGNEASGRARMGTWGSFMGGLSTQASPKKYKYFNCLCLYGKLGKLYTNGHTRERSYTKIIFHPRIYSTYPPKSFPSFQNHRKPGFIDPLHGEAAPRSEGGRLPRLAPDHPLFSTLWNLPMTTRPTMTDRELRDLLAAHFAVIEGLPGADDWRPGPAGLRSSPRLRLLDVASRDRPE